MSSNQKVLRSHMSQDLLAAMLFIVVMMGVLSACGSHATSSPPGSSGTWKVVPSPNAGLDLNELRAVAVVSTRDVWAVGYSQPGLGDVSVDQTLIEHWNGTRWSIVKSPTDPRIVSGELSGVTALSASDIWAVGESYNISPPYYQTLIEHWNGTRWSIVPSPSPGKASNKLNGVMALSSSDIWAVGEFSTPPSVSLIEHVGASAVQMTGGSGFDAPAGPHLIGVKSQSLIEHWNGTRWSVVKSPNPGLASNELRSVAIVSASDVWAVGESSESPALIEHWNGATWNVVKSPSPGFLSAVTALSATDVWAVGVAPGSGSHPGGVQPLIEHWNGSSWSVVKSPNPGSDLNELSAVATVSARDVWAVGDFYSSRSSERQALIEHWNGSTWSIVKSPNPGSDLNELSGVAALSATDVWAVGFSRSDPENKSQVLIEHYS